MSPVEEREAPAGPGAANERAAWFRSIAASIERLDVYGMAIVAIDTRSGRFLAATSTARDLCGGSLPPQLADLVDDGLIARPDLDRLVRHLGRRDPQATGDTTRDESSRSWSDALRLRRRESAPFDLRLEVIVHSRPSIAAEAAIVTVWHDDATSSPGEPPSVLDELWALYDADYRMVAADPGFSDLSIEPRSQLGTLAWLYVHPDDVPAVQPLVAAVMAGHLRTVRYSARVRARGGRWLAAHVDVRRLEAADGPQLMVVTRYIDETRRTIRPGVLSARELVVVDALFAGLRVGQIADQEGVAVKTVRNQLAAIYRKLDVTGQLDLLGSYHRPADREPSTDARRRRHPRGTDTP